MKKNKSLFVVLAAFAVLTINTVAHADTLILKCNDLQSGNGFHAQIFKITSDPNEERPWNISFAMESGYSDSLRGQINVGNLQFFDSKNRVAVRIDTSAVRGSIPQKRYLVNTYFEGYKELKCTVIERARD